MSLARFDFGMMNRLHRDLEQALNENRPVALIPRVEVQELAERYVLRADLPGVAPQDIEVNTDQGVLTLSAKRSTGQSGTVSYQRRFSLPEDAEANDITARSSTAYSRSRLVRPRRLSHDASLSRRPKARIRSIPSSRWICDP
jgi:HSP20 family protein